MKHFQVIKNRANKFYNNGLKMDLNYLVAYGANGERSEINSCESYCEDCINEKMDGIQSVFEIGGSEAIFQNYDVNSDKFEITEILFSEESCPEKDGFENCEKCGSLIRVSILHTFSDELEYYLSDDKSVKLKELSNEDCYRINEIIFSQDSIERHPKLVKKLRKKIREQNSASFL